MSLNYHILLPPERLQIGITNLTINNQPVSFNNLQFTQGTNGVEIRIPELNEQPLAIILGLTVAEIDNTTNFI